MSDKPSYEFLEQQVKQLELAVARTRRAEAVNKALFHIVSALNTSETLQDLYRSIHIHLSSLMDMTNFFIAIYYKDKNAIRYVFRKDREASFSPKWVHNFRKNPSLTGDVILKKRPLLLDEAQLAELGDKGRVLGRLPKNWLGVPLMVQGDVLGVMAVKSYTNPVKYNQDHVELLSFVSKTIAAAIEKKQAGKDLQRARSRLIRSQKLEAIGTLAGGIAHDFNNTLSIVLGNINLAQMIVSSDTVKEYLADAEQSVLQAKELASKFTVFSKGGGIHIKSHIDIHGFLDEMIQEIEAEHLISCQLTVSDLPPVIEADPDQLRMALKNIVINAGEAMASPGVPVQVTACAHPDRPGRIIISVTDHGRGISEGDMQKVFDPYFSTKPMGKNKGRGLGLSIAWAVAKNHQGAVTIDSSLGQGTRVDMVLPVFQKESLGTEVAKAPAGGMHPAPRPASRKPLVLFMDDDALILEITGKILEQLGYEPVLARSGEQAIERYSACLVSGKIIGKVVLDIEVKQGMGGIEAMARLLAMNPAVKGVVSSGYSEDPAMVDFALFGFSASLSKPFSIETLRRTLQEL